MILKQRWAVKSILHGVLSFSSVQRKVIEESQKVDRLFCIICIKTLIPRSLIEVWYGSLVNWVQAVSLNLSVLCMKMKSLTAVSVWKWTGELQWRVLFVYVNKLGQVQSFTISLVSCGLLLKGNFAVVVETLKYSVQHSWDLIDCWVQSSLSQNSNIKNHVTPTVPLPPVDSSRLSPITLHLGTTVVEKAVRINLVSASLRSKVFVHRVQSLLNFIFQTHSR